MRQTQIAGVYPLKIYPGQVGAAGLEPTMAQRGLHECIINSMPL